MTGNEEEKCRCVYCGRTEDDFEDKLKEEELFLRESPFLLQMFWNNENKYRRDSNMPEIEYDEERIIRNHLNYHKTTLIRTEKVHYIDKKTGEMYYDYGPVCIDCAIERDELPFR